MLLVQLGINSTRDVWKFAKLDSPRRLVQFWQNFQTSLVPQAAQSYPVLLITLYLYIMKIIRKSCVINLLRYIFI